MTATTGPIELVTTKPDHEIAADLIKRMRDAVAPVCEIMDEAHRQGLMVQFDGIGMGPPMHRFQIINLRIVKVLG